MNIVTAEYAGQKIAEYLDEYEEYLESPAGRVRRLMMPELTEAARSMVKLKNCEGVQEAFVGEGNYEQMEELYEKCVKVLSVFGLNEIITNGFEKVKIQNKNEDKLNWIEYGNPVRNLHPEYDTELKVSNLLDRPIRNEVPLPINLKNRLIRDNGWIDITQNEDERTRIANDLKEKVFDPDTRPHWFVRVYPNYEPVHGQSGYRGTVYQVYTTPVDAKQQPLREYFDVNGNGRIDFYR